MGPKLFLLYINDICNVSNILQFILFADDTNTFCSGENLHVLSNMISQEMKKLYVWFALNKLSLNVAKTNFMVFSNTKRVENVNITINESVIERVHQTKF